jgi:hypothetical protein
MVPPANLDDLSHAELKNLVVALFEQVAELRRTIAAQAARPNGGPHRLQRDYFTSLLRLVCDFCRPSLRPNWPSQGIIRRNVAIEMRRRNVDKYRISATRHNGAGRRYLYVQSIGLMESVD